jgi:hypothetical protein
MRKFDFDEFVLLTGMYNTFIDEYDDYAFDTNRYDFEELEYQRDNLENCDIDSCEFFGRYGEYISKVISFCEMVGVSNSKLKDEIVNKLRNSFTNILNSEELRKKYEECRDNSPAVMRAKIYGGGSLESLMETVMF